MIFNKEVRNSGFSLVQVMIGLGLTGMLALVMTKINQQGTKASRSLEARVDLNRTLNDLTQLHIHDSASCLRNFGPNGVSLNNVNDTTVATNLNGIYNNAGTLVLTNGTLIGSGSYRVTGTQMQPFKPNAPGSSEGLCTLDVTIDVEANKITATQRKTYNIDFYCSVDLTDPGGFNDPIINCMPSTNSTYNSLWDFTLMSGSEFINWAPVGGLGSVVIGALGADPEVDDTAALNLNINGTAWNGIREGISFNNDTTLSFGRWHITGEANYLSYLYFNEVTGNLSAPVLYYADRTEFAAFDATETTQSHHLLMRGDLVLRDAARSKFFNIRADADYTMLDFNKGTRNFSDGSFSFGATNQGSSIWALDHANQELLLAIFPEAIQGSTILPANLRQYTPFRTKAGGQYIFGDQSVSMHPTNSTYTMLMGTSLVFSGGDYNWALANNSTYGGDFNYLFGGDLTGGGSFTFVFGERLNVGSEFNFLHGSDLNSLNTYNFLHGTRITNNKNNSFLFGSDITSPVATNNGHAYFGNGLNYKTAVLSGTTPVIRIDRPFTLYDDGSLHLMTGSAKASANGPGHPARLSFSPAKAFYAGGNGDWNMIGSNLYRYCKTVSNCQNYTEPGAGAQFGFSGIMLNEENIIFPSLAGTGSNVVRAETTRGAISTTSYTRISSTSTIFEGDWGMSNRDMTAEDIVATPVPPSDLRLKENINGITEDFAINILKLGTYSYKFKKNKNPNQVKIGFIAQEVEEVFPKLVSKMKNGFLGINLNSFYALATKVAQKFIKILQSLLADLESNLTQINQLIFFNENTQKKNNLIFNEFRKLENHSEK